MYLVVAVSVAVKMQISLSFTVKNKENDKSISLLRNMKSYFFLHCFSEALVGDGERDSLLGGLGH